MKAAVLYTFGTVPRCEEFPDPIAEEGEVVVDVCAASLKPVDRQMADGSHYASAHQLPVICGTDGVGRLADGQRVFFGGSRSPYGAIAQRTVVRKPFAFPIPDTLDDLTAAAIPNPGVSAWLSLSSRAKLAAGENVLILGATGTTGKLAVKIAKLLGAGRVVAAGRNVEVLSKLREQGADEVIRLDKSREELIDAFATTAAKGGVQVVIDYLWGVPAEAFLAAITRKDFAAIQSETRYVQIGESAGARISLPAAVLRSTPLTLAGTAGVPPAEVLIDALQNVLKYAADGVLQVATESVPLTEIEAGWMRDSKGRRLVIIP